MLNIIRKKSLGTIHLPAEEKAALNYFKKELLKRLGGEVIEIRLYSQRRLRYLEGIPTVFFQVIKSDAIKL